MVGKLNIYLRVQNIFSFIFRCFDWKTEAFKLYIKKVIHYMFSFFFHKVSIYKDAFTQCNFLNHYCLCSFFKYQLNFFLKIQQKVFEII